MISQQRALVRMPEVIGLPLGKARLLVENAGLSVDAVVFMESYDARDTVLTQKPSRGQMIYAGEPVTLGISRESYAKWLPSIYQRGDLNGKNFVRDLLWIIQHLFSSIDEKLDAIHHIFDPHEAPESFLPWLASWSAMVLEEDWPVTKKRRLIKKGIELYRIRGTVKGLKLFISLFTGHEPSLQENVWPFKGWRVGVSSEIAVDTVVLPPVNLAHAFVVEMPVAYKDLSPEAVIRIHEIIQMEKPANTQYYLRFASEQKSDELRQFMAIGTRSGIGIGEEAEAITSEEELQRLLDKQGREPERARSKTQADEEADDAFKPASRIRAPLTNVPRADLAPVEGKEVRSDAAGGFGASARQMEAITDTQMLKAVDPELEAAKTVIVEAPAQKSEKTTVTAPKEPKRAADDKKTQLGVPTHKPETKPEAKNEKKPDKDPENKKDDKGPKK